MGLNNGQTLRLANGTQAEVVHKNGSLAFLITAEEAHDATGAPVPTSLKVSGNVLTLEVEFNSKPFVYPIVSGQGWETSYTVPTIIEGPEDETQIREREEQKSAEREEQEAREQQERESGEGGEGEPPAPPLPPSGHFTLQEVERMIEDRPRGPEVVAAPEPATPPPGAASASSVSSRTVHPFKDCNPTSCEHLVGRNQESFLFLRSR